MKLISLNIEVNKHYDRILPFFEKEQADILCLYEVLEDDFERLKKELNMHGIYKPFDYSRKNPFYEDTWGRRKGTAIFARNIIDSGYVFYSGREENVFKSFEEYLAHENYQKNSVLVWVDVKDSSGKIFKIFCTHLPVTKEGVSSPFQLEILDLLFKELDLFSEFVLCGDMNAPRGNETFSRLAKRYQDNIPLEYKTSVDQNLHKVKGIQFMVDGLFTTPEYIASNVKLVDSVSDHMAVVANIEKI